MSEIGKALAVRGELTKHGSELSAALVAMIKRFIEEHGKEATIREILAFDMKHGVEWWNHLPEKIYDDDVLDVIIDVDVGYLTGEFPRPPGWNSKMGYTEGSVAGNTKKK